MPKLRSTSDGRLIYKTSYERCFGTIHLKSSEIVFVNWLNYDIPKRHLITPKVTIVSRKLYKINFWLIRYDTIRDATLTCARKPTWVSLIYRTIYRKMFCKLGHETVSKSVGVCRHISRLLQGRIRRRSVSVRLPSSSRLHVLFL